MRLRSAMAVALSKMKSRVSAAAEAWTRGAKIGKDLKCLVSVVGPSNQETLKVENGNQGSLRKQPDMGVFLGLLHRRFSGSPRGGRLPAFGVKGCNPSHGGCPRVCVLGA
jgi:hypothetical protein